MNRSTILKIWLPIAVFSTLWLDLIRLLSTQWETREQYAYGWFVPFFALGLLWRRWLDRPGKGPQDHGTTGPRDQKPEVSGPRSVVSSQLSVVTPQRSVVGGPPPRVSGHSAAVGGQQSAVNSPWSLVVGPWSFFAFCFVLCLLLLPLRVTFEINTDWPFISWLYTLIVVALTLYAFHLAGPPPSVHGPWSLVRSPAVSGPVVSSPWSLLSPWVRHFAFPVCFILVAVAWPYRIEKGLTQGLMRVVASITVELLGWLDIPALQRGNLIDLGTGTVGIDEACSGIRSFQSSLMAALLMGELYRLRLLPRAALVAIGIALGFCFNVVRTLILSYQANAHGIGAIEKWHDPAGFTITIACFFCLWGLAVLIKRRTTEPRPMTTDHRPRTADSLTTVHGPQSTVHSPSAPVSSPAVPNLQPSAFSLQPSPEGPVVSSPVVRSPVVPWSRFALAVGLWALVCIGATEAWYRSHKVKDAGVFQWSVALPEHKPGFQKVELPPRSLRLLAFDAGATAKWNEDGGSECSLFFFRWNPRSIQSVIQSRIHRPEVCLPASGFKQLTESELVLFDAGQFKLPFRKYTYEADGQILYLFFCQWEDGAEQQSGMGASGQSERLRTVWVGRRLVGQQTLELIVVGSPSLAEAETLVRRRLPELIQPSGN